MGRQYSPRHPLRIRSPGISSSFHAYHIENCIGSTTAKRSRLNRVYRSLFEARFGGSHAGAFRGRLCDMGHWAAIHCSLVFPIPTSTDRQDPTQPAISLEILLRIVL